MRRSIDCKRADREGSWSWHYLTDGIFEINYQMEDGEFVVKSTEYYSDFAMYRDNYDQRHSKDGRILDMDRIK